MGEADKEYQSIVGLVREVEAIVKQHQVPGGLQNPYTTLTAHVSMVVSLVRGLPFHPSVISSFHSHIGGVL